MPATRARAFFTSLQQGNPEALNTEKREGSQLEIVHQHHLKNKRAAETDFGRCVVRFMTAA